jgi:hypothetical protein
MHNTDNGTGEYCAVFYIIHLSLFLPVFVVS